MQKGARARRSRRRSESPRLTVKTYIGWLIPGNGEALPEAPRWPPDAFAVTASLLRQAAAYSSIVESWPPNGSLAEWAEAIRRVGESWRAVATSRAPLPLEVRRWWRAVQDEAELPIDRVCQRDALCEALLQLTSAADEAARGMGIRETPSRHDPFDIRASDLLVRNERRSFCDRVHPTRAVVLPKLHTPRSGLTLRSLTHHLALCSPSEVRAEWLWLPFRTGDWGLNLVVLPWPEDVQPAHFNASTSVLNMPEDFGLFSCDTRQGRPLGLPRVRKAVRQAEEKVGAIHGVIFPELALRGDDDLAVCHETGAFVVGGLGAAPRNGQSGRNAVAVAVPVPGGEITRWTQEKHHRWKLDRNQITQYGLGARLDPDREWWEHTRSTQRELRFCQFNGWLTMCVLVCEDLARQDPVADVVRAVGPNLVIALLMDGPQLDFRWPARYATVLAEDPGSSVLTVTSLGMARLSRPQGAPESRVVALWKDALADKAVQIELSKEATGCVLSLTRRYRKEWTADGRDDNGTTGYLCLSGVREITL